MLKNYQYRIYPTKKQQRVLATHLEACRILYNQLLEMRNTAYERDGISLSCFQQQKTYPVLKEQHPLLRAVHSQVLQNVAVRVDLAYQAFFRRCKAAEKPGFPRFVRCSKLSVYEWKGGSDLPNGFCPVVPT